MASSFWHHPHLGNAHASNAGEGTVWCGITLQEDDVHALQVDWLSNIIFSLHLLEHKGIWEGCHDDGHGFFVRRGTRPRY